MNQRNLALMQIVSAILTKDDTYDYRAAARVMAAAAVYYPQTATESSEWPTSDDLRSDALELMDEYRP